MEFQVDDRVVYPACGVGRIVGLVIKSFSEAEARPYYEVSIENGTVWVAVDSGPAAGLRPLTPRADLERYREVLRSRPAPLPADHRERRLTVLSRLKTGSFQDTCEIVRDLSARGWNKALGQADAAALKKARENLCREWAAAEGLSVEQAAAEVDALLRQGRETYHP